MNIRGHINQVLSRALELDAAELRAWLEQLYQSDPEAAAAVERLLARRREPAFAHFLSGHAVPATPRQHLAGEQLGDYVIESEIGSGGMGSVWRARRSDGLYEGIVAVKYLNSRWQSAAGRARFKREGTLLARLDHPNIARLLDAGVTTAGEPYLVLEYVAGQPIDAYCDTQRLTLEARIELFLEVLAAVQHAHGSLIVHRDIKPANILITADGKVKLLDFGIARLIHEEEALTHTGAQLMTPHYAAPEQFQRNTVPSTAVDLYSLGVLLYLLLTGHQPFVSGEPTPLQLLQRILAGEVPQPSTLYDAAEAISITSARQRSASVRTLRAALRGDLDSIVLKAMRAEPRDRYSSAGDFAADLRRFLNHQPVLARQDFVSYRLQKFARRHRVGVAVGLCALVVVGFVIGLISAQRVEASWQRAQAELNSRRARSVSDLLDLFMTSVQDPLAPPLTYVESINQGVAMVERQYADDPGFAGRMLVHLGTRLPTEEVTRASELLSRAYQMGTATADADLMVSALCSQVAVRTAAGLAEDAEPSMRYAQRLLASSRSTLDLRVACLSAEANLQALRGDPAAAILALRRAVDDVQRSDAAHEPKYIYLLTTLGSLYSEEPGMLPEALRTMTRAASLNEHYGRGDTVDHLMILRNLGRIRLLGGEVSTALELHLRTTERMHLTPELSPAIRLHAALLLRLQRPQQALQVLDGLLARSRAGDNPVELLDSLLAVIAARTANGQLQAAQALLVEAQALLESDAAEAYVRRLVTLANVELALAGGNVALARRHSDELLRLSGYRTEQTRRPLGRALLLASRVAVLENNLPMARQFAADSLTIAEANALATDTSADVGEALLQLAKTELALGTPANIRTRLERAERCLANGLTPDHPLTQAARRLLRQ